jgi:hypothetical protein
VADKIIVDEKKEVVADKMKVDEKRRWWLTGSRFMRRIKRMWRRSF